MGVLFVGLAAGILVIAELLRRLHSGLTFELVAGSASALEAVRMQTDPSSSDTFPS